MHNIPKKRCPERAFRARLDNLAAKRGRTDAEQFPRHPERIARTQPCKGQPGAAQASAVHAASHGERSGQLLSKFMDRDKAGDDLWRISSPGHDAFDATTPPRHCAPPAMSPGDDLVAWRQAICRWLRAQWKPQQAASGRKMAGGRGTAIGAKYAVKGMQSEHELRLVRVDGPIPSSTRRTLCHCYSANNP